MPIFASPGKKSIISLTLVIITLSANVKVMMYKIIKIGTKKYLLGKNTSSGASMPTPSHSLPPCSPNTTSTTFPLPLSTISLVGPTLGQPWDGSENFTYSLFEGVYIARPRSRLCSLNVVTSVNIILHAVFAGSVQGPSHGSPTVLTIILMLTCLIFVKNTHVYSNTYHSWKQHS